MSKLKAGIIIFTIIFFIFFIILIISSAKTDETLNKESKNYVDTVLPKILYNFDENVFMQYAAPELIKNVSQDKVKKIFLVYKELGKFEKYLGSKGKAKVSFAIMEWKKWTYAKYTAKAKFSKGDANIKITIIKENGQWYIYHLKITSKVFNKESKKKS
jgi:hypothetical protein